LVAGKWYIERKYDSRRHKKYMTEMMRTETRAILGGTIFILLFGIASSAFINNSYSIPRPETAYGSWACTTDAQVCPDGSTVGRVPPYCQFAQCPN